MAIPVLWQLGCPYSVLATTNFMLALVRLRTWLAKITSALPWQFVSESPLPGRESFTCQSPPPTPQDLDEVFSTRNPVLWFVQQLPEYSDSTHVPVEYKEYMESRQLCTLLCYYAQLMFTNTKTSQMTLFGVDRLNPASIASIMAVRSKTGR